MKHLLATLSLSLTLVAPAYAADSTTTDTMKPMHDCGDMKMETMPKDGEMKSDMKMDDTKMDGKMHDCMMDEDKMMKDGETMMKSDG
ncbi:MAG: hypothetical protein ACPGVK_06885 [Halocynthiibacter sp.]